MVPKSFLTALSLLLLISCGDTKPVEVVTVEKPLKIAQPSKPASIQLEDIKWRVINHEDAIYYSLAIADYKILANNMLEIKRYITEQNNVITYYENATK